MLQRANLLSFYRGKLTSDISISDFVLFEAATNCDTIKIRKWIVKLNVNFFEMLTNSIESHF